MFVLSSICFLVFDDDYKFDIFLSFSNPTFYFENRALSKLLEIVKRRLFEWPLGYISDLPNLTVPHLVIIYEVFRSMDEKTQQLKRCRMSQNLF